MALPSITDALIVIVLLIPGFVAFWLVKRLGRFNRPLSEFESSLWSFVLSAIILFFFTSLTGLSNIDKIRDEFFYPINFGLLFVLTAIIGLLGGALLRVSNRNRTAEESQSFAFKLNQRYVKKIKEKENALKELKLRKKISEEEYNKRTISLNPARESSLLTVYTRDNKKFTGYLRHSSDGSWDILLQNAFGDKEKIDGEDWDILLLKGDDISRIVFKPLVDYDQDNKEQN